MLVLVLGAPMLGATVDAQVTEQAADLAVDQPDYIDQEVTRSSTNGTPLYTVHAGAVDLKPQNFGNGTVVGFGVDTSSGSLSYDESFDVFRFDAEGNVGTFELYWEVEEQRTVQVNNSTEVQSVRTRYEAVIRVDENPQYQHVPASEIDQDQAAAENWSEWEESLQDLYGDDVDVETRTQQAFNYLRLSNNPFAALSGQFSAVLLTLFITIGGGLVLALFGVYHIGTRWTDIKYIQRNESLKAGEQDLEERVAALQDDERRRALQNLDWNDIFEDDRVARAFRDALGETVFDGTVKLQELLLPENLIRDRLQAMGLNGWVGVDDDQGARLTRDDELEDVDVAEVVDLSSPSDEFIERLDWNDQNLRTFDLPNADVRPEDEGTAVRLDGLDLEELMRRLDVQEQDFDSPEVWGHYLQEFVEDVRHSPYCDETGEPDTTRFVMNNWLQLSQTLRDRHGFPLFDMTGDAIERALVDIDPVADAEEIVDDVESGVGS